MWKAEASLHGTQLAIPPQRDPSRARLTDGPYKDPRSLRNRNRTPMFGEKDVVDTHVLGVGATPTAELEDDKEEEGKLEAGQKKFDKPKIQVEIHCKPIYFCICFIFTIFKKVGHTGI